MPREKTYRVQTRQSGEPWRTLWAGPGEAVAIEAAQGVATETRTYTEFGNRPEVVVHVHPYVRVVCNGKTVFEVTPATRNREAVA